MPARVVLARTTNAPVRGEVEREPLPAARRGPTTPGNQAWLPWDRLRLWGAVRECHDAGGQADPRSAGVFDLFVGVLKVVPFCTVTTAEDPVKVPKASGIFLFRFTHPYSGVTAPGGFDSSELGWYCPWVAIIAVVYSILNFFSFGDVLPRAGRGW